MKKIAFEILVSTMNRTDLSFLFNMFKNVMIEDYQILIINQTTKDKLLESSYKNIRVINSFETGLSKSRNLALENAKGELCVITDDDVIFNKGFIDIIIEAFSKFPDATIIRLCVNDINGKVYKKYPKRAKRKLSDLDILSTMSVELIYNRKKVLYSQLKFDEQFGLGANYPLGEEQILLKDLKRKGYKLYYYPKCFVSHPQDRNSAKLPFQNFWYTIGAVYTKMFKSKKYFWLSILFFFLVKQRKIELKKLISAYKNFKQGSQNYLNK